MARGGVWLLAMLSLMGVWFIPCSATSADKTDRLIELLVKKGIVNREEAAALKQELEKEGKAGAEKTPVATPAVQETTAPEWTRKVEVKYDKGAVIKTTDDRFSIKLNARVQGVFAHEDFDTGDDSTTFRIRRARVLAGGNVLYPWLKYGIQLTLEGADAALRDAYIEAAYYDQLVPKVGQYKVPFDREFLTSGFELQLIDRSLANAEFSLQRDIGLQFSGRPLGDALEYRVGVFNGSGGNRSNVDDDMMYVGRLVWTPLGVYKYSQAALDSPSSPRLALGVGAAYLPGLEPGERRTLAGRLGNTQIVPVESDVSQFVADLAFKYRGFSLEGGYYHRNIDPKSATAFGEQDAEGFYIQSGLFLVPERFEIAGRYSYVEPDNPNQIDNNEEEELTVGGTYYFLGHQVKGQLNYSFFKRDMEPEDEDEHLIQASMILAF